MSEAGRRILVVDDHELIRVGIRRILVEGLAAKVTEAADARTALELVRSKRWDLVILDLSLPDSDGLEVLKQMKVLQPATPVLVLTILPEEQVALRVFRAGADGFLPKGSAARDLLAAAQMVLGGGKYVSQGAASRMIEELRADNPPQRHATLSDREEQVFRAIAGGLTVTQIAGKMRLSVKTVSTYRMKALQKLKLENNAQMISYAHKHGLV